jgi:S1-C subfamily serine protease
MYVSDGTKNYVITAEHVCTENTPEQFEHDGIKFKINKTIEIKLKTVKGKTYDAEVIGLEEHDDLCALKTESFTHPIRIADEPPKMGDRVFAIAAPYGLGGTNLALIFSGYYSGKRKSWHFYSIPTRPGSSGSVVMNEDWEAIGLLHTAYIPLEHIGMGAGWYELRAFFNNLP